MKKKIIIAVGILAAIAIIGGTLWFFLGRNSGKSGEDVVYVSKVSTVMNGGSLGIPNRFSGVVEPQQTYEIQLQPDKTVKEVLVKKGQDVLVGTPLFNYNTEQTQNDLNQAELDMDRIDNDIDNLYGQIKTLEKEKKAADADEKLNYTTQIQTAQTDIKKNEYELKSKKIEIEKLKDSIENATVTSEIAGVVKSINQSGSGDDSGSAALGETGNAFITILETGQFRIKGTVNEQNMSAIMEGAPAIIRSRVDEKTWAGSFGKVDMESGKTGNSSMMYGGGADNAENQSSNYPFYVSLDSADGLMLGQHVYIEVNMGQEEEKIGVWLPDYMISDIDSDPYVWADNGKGKLEKRKVVLGQYDEELMKYEIADGVTEEDAITFPEESLEEGQKTEITKDGQMGNQAAPAEGGEEQLMDGASTDTAGEEEPLDGASTDTAGDGQAIGGASAGEAQ